MAYLPPFYFCSYRWSLSECSHMIDCSVWLNLNCLGVRAAEARRQENLNEKNVAANPSQAWRVPFRALCSKEIWRTGSTLSLVHTVFSTTGHCSVPSGAKVSKVCTGAVFSLFQRICGNCNVSNTTFQFLVFASKIFHLSAPVDFFFFVCACRGQTLSSWPSSTTLMRSWTRWPPSWTASTAEKTLSDAPCWSTSFAPVRSAKEDSLFVNKTWKQHWSGK